MKKYKRVRLKGHDKIATFDIRRRTCNVCGRQGILCVVYPHNAPPDYDLCTCGSSQAIAARYHADGCPFRTEYDVPVYRMLTWHDLLLHTILGKAFKARRGVGALGIQCGCYASFQRQITHISESVQKKIEARTGVAPAVERTPDDSRTWDSAEPLV